MKIADVQKLSMFDRLAYWIQEREKIRLAKEQGLPKPWTDDEILQSYRFCNVRRMDDKVSQWLFNNWYDQYFDHYNILPAVALARFINKPETLEKIGFPQIWKPKVIKDRVRKMQANGDVVFNAAYMVRGSDGTDKIESVVDYFCSPLVGKDFPRGSMKELHGWVLSHFGFGSFMAGQVAADLRHACDGEFADKDTWAAIGPGSRRGMNRLLGRDLKSPMKQDEFDEQLVVVMYGLGGVLPYELTERLEAIDYQNCLCELDKVCRCLDGGRAKQKYNGGEV